jgi:LytS/YehU family sensor histidine kinase
LSDEIQYLSTYLTLEQLRFNHRFTFRISYGDLPAELIYIPSMMLQPFVENSIRHGKIGSLAHEGLLEVRFEEMDDDFLKCTIMDNGTGLNSDKTYHQKGVHAMSIIQDRIKLYNDSQSMKIRFEVRNRADGAAGVMVEILLPILYNEND